MIGRASGVSLCHSGVGWLARGSVSDGAEEGEVRVRDEGEGVTMVTWGGARESEGGEWGEDWGEVVMG